MILSIFRLSSSESCGRSGDASGEGILFEELRVVVLAENLRAGLLDAGEAQSNQALVDGVRDLFATPADILGGKEVAGVIVADLTARAEAWKRIEGRENVSEGVVVPGERRPHHDWRPELLAEFIDEKAVVRPGSAD
jgi:hypothetical protein